MRPSRSSGVMPINFIILGQVKETVYIPPMSQNLNRLQICTWGTCESYDMQILSTDLVEDWVMFWLSVESPWGS